MIPTAAVLDMVRTGAITSGTEFLLDEEFPGEVCKETTRLKTNHDIRQSPFSIHVQKEILIFIHGGFFIVMSAFGRCICIGIKKQWIRACGKVYSSSILILPEIFIA